MKVCMLNSIFKILKLNQIKIIIIGLIVINFWGCDALFVDDLTGQKVELVKPNDNYTTGQYKVYFEWEEMDDAEEYELMVVTVTDNSFSYYLDTVVTDLSYTAVLVPDEYNWFVIASNYYGEAYSDTLYLVVDSSGSSTNFIPEIESPTTSYVNDETIKFSWSTYVDVDEFRFEIREGDWEDGDIDSSIIISGSAISVEFSEGEYSWGVQSIIDNVYSSFVYQDLIIDLTDPDDPELDSPDDNSTSSDSEVEFSWESTSDDGAPIYDVLYISTSKNFTTSTLVESIKSTDETVTYEFEESGTYYWRVKTFDKAGNSSDYSDSRSITID